MADVFERNGSQPAQQPGRVIGNGHAQAMARLGLRELRNAFNPSPGSVADTEMGLYGTAGPMEVAGQQGVQPQRADGHKHDTPPQPQRDGRER
jgi:hypothetical protein